MNTLRLLPRGRTRAAAVAAYAWLALAGCGFAFFVSQVTFGVAGRKLDHFASTWVYDGLELIAVAAIAARAALVRPERAAWLLMAFGVGSWTLGDISWTVVYHGNPPFPSWADVLYLSYYPPMFVALALLVRLRLSRFSPSVWLDGVMASLAVASIGAAVLLDVVIRSSHGSWIANATNLAYPLGDIVLLALLVGVFALAGWRPGWSWSAIAAALTLNAVADSIYLYQSAVGSYVAGTVLDALWPLSLLALAIAAWLAPNGRRPIVLEGRALAATPLLCGLAAIAVLVDSYFQHRNLVGVALAAATLVTMIGRTLLTFRENAQVTERASTLARTDSLTGLWNRRKLLADLDVALASRTPEPRILVLYDLNGFKLYNDSFGHPAGDALLSRLANKLAHALPAGASCYRLGGDEFCVLAPVEPSRTEALLSDTSEALSERGEGFDITTAFGCVFLPDEAKGAAEALRVADQRLYAQKYDSLLRAGQPHRVLLQALFEREPEMRDHVRGVARLALAVGRELGIAEDGLVELEMAAQLHDIGKLAIPDATLSKPGPLDMDDWALIHQHTAIGERILAASPAFQQVGRVVRATHERWDGQGYPDGLAGEAIPLAARVIAVCDAYSAMTTERAYRRSLEHEHALAELRRCAGGQFDAQVVAAFGRARLPEAVVGAAAAAAHQPSGVRR